MVEWVLVLAEGQDFSRETGISQQMQEKLGLLERLEKGIVLGAEGYLFELERRGYLQAGAYVPEVVLEQPGAVKELHREFLYAGSDVMVALTYYAHREKLRAVGREGDLERLNREAIRLAQEVAAEGDALVAGDISNTWVYDHLQAAETGKVVRGMYEEQVGWAADEGVDFVIAETLDYVGEALIALEVIKDAGLPSVITFGSVRDSTKDGYDFVTACQILEDHGADVVGMNCSRGPRTMLPIIRDIRQAVKGHVAAQPVAYRTSPAEPAFQALKDTDGRRAFPIALDPFQATRFEMAEFATEARDTGVNYIGICCGAAPHHVRAMAEALGRTVPASRYSSDLSRHPMLGAHLKERDKGFLADWKDE
jgi:betaine-homocysteine S-methyltransferase